MAREKWYVAGLRFECTLCGNCCSGAPGDVWVNEKERRDIATFLGLSYDDFMTAHVRREGSRYSLNEKGPKDNWDCVFLVEKEGQRVCGIYSVRPTQCRTWPFWNQNLRSPETWKDADQICPGLNQGAHYDFVQIEIARSRRL